MSGQYDEITIFGGNSNPYLTEQICDYLGLRQGRADVFKFSNDNTFPAMTTASPRTTSRVGDVLSDTRRRSHGSRQCA